MNKRVLKILSLLLVSLLVISVFVSCGGSGEQKEENKDYVMPEDKANLNTALEYSFLEDEYRTAINGGGRLEKISYTAHKYYGTGGEATKNATVYLPAGYDESDLLYNVLYLLHGAGGNEETYMGTQDNPTALKYIIDHAIENGDIKPLIIVMPTSESDDDADADMALEISNGFYEEVVSDIIPAVEGKYRTAAYGHVSEENLKATRLHRAFGGFSMGSVSTWGVLEHAMDYFGYFLPMSGGSWTIRVNGDSKKPQETAKALEEAKNAGVKVLFLTCHVEPDSLVIVE